MMELASQGSPDTSSLALRALGSSGKVWQTANGLQRHLSLHGLLDIWRRLEGSANPFNVLHTLHCPSHRVRLNR